MITNNEIKKILNLLDELVSINENQCSEEDIFLVKRFISVGETDLALEEFCGMWSNTNKPPLNSRSYEIIRETSDLSNLDFNVLTKQLS